MPAAKYDLVLRNGVIIDGTGGARVGGEVAIRGDRIVAVARDGQITDAEADTEIDVGGQVIARGGSHLLAWPGREPMGHMPLGRVMPPSTVRHSPVTQPHAGERR